MGASDSFRTFVAAYRFVLKVGHALESSAGKFEVRSRSLFEAGAAKLGLAGEQSSWLNSWSAFVIFFALLISRSYLWMRNPQFYIEDGPEFYAKAFKSSSPALFESYMGYYHLVPRGIAFLASRLPPAFGPLVMEIFATGIQAVSASFFLSARLKRQIPSIVLRAAIGLLVVGYPYSNEMFANIAHSQWYLALLCVTVLCSEPGASKFSRVSDWGLVGTVSLTGPFSLILAPIAWFLARKDGHRAVLAAILSIGLVVTVVSIFSHPRLGVHGAPRFSLFERILSTQVVIGSTLGFNQAVKVEFEPFFTWPEFTYAAFSVVVIGFVLLRGQPWIRGLAVLGLYSLFACLYAGGNWVMLGNGGVGERYFFFLGLVFVVGCAMGFRAAPRAWERVGFLTIVTFTVAGMVWNWRYDPPFDRFNYARQIAAYEGLRPGERLKIATPIDRKSAQHSWTVELIKR